MLKLFLNYFTNYKYSKLLISKFFELYSFYSLRSVLVLVFVLSLHLSDSNSFKIYTTFVVCGDLISIAGGYFGDRLLTRRISLVIGMVFSSFGYIYSFFNFNFFGVCVGLIFAGIGMGFSRANSNVIINDYIQEEIEEDSRHNHNGIFHITTILALLGGFLINGIILKFFDHRLIFLFSGFSMIISLLIFLMFELNKLKNDLIFTFLRNPHENDVQIDYEKASFFHNFNWQKFFKTNLIILFCLMFSSTLYYLLQTYDQNFFIKNIKILIVMAVVFLSFFLIKKSKHFILKEKQAILSMILYLPYYLIYMAFEKQLDMNFSLFLFRAVDRNIFGFEIPAANISAVFSLTILIISFFFLKKSIYCYFKHNTILIFGFLATVFHFGFALLGCQISILFSSKVHLIFPVLSLICLAIADIFIVPRMYSLCRMAPETIKSFSSSLMMLCHGSGFYFAGILAQLAAVKNIDPLIINENQNSSDPEIIKIYFISFGIFMLINLTLLISVFIIGKLKVGTLLARK